MGEKFLKRKSENSMKAMGCGGDVIALSHVTMREERSLSIGRRRVAASVGTSVDSADSAMTLIGVTPTMIDAEQSIELAILRADPSDPSCRPLVSDELIQPSYVTCASTGKKLFRVVLGNFLGFPAASKDDVAIKLCGRRLVIYGTGQSFDNVDVVRRSINIPRDVIIDQLHCALCRDKIEIEAPVLELPSVANLFLSQQQQQQQQQQLQQQLSQQKQQATPPLPPPPSAGVSGNSAGGYHLRKKAEALLNAPYLTRALDGTERMEVVVEIGRVFRADDVIIKMKGQGRLIVSAQREESNSHGKLSASLVREIALPVPILHNTIRAVFTQDGLLRVNARVKASAHKTPLASSFDSTTTSSTTIY